MSNTFGNIYTLTSFGESHGPAVGGVIDGCPAGVEIDMEFIQRELNRRRPGQSNIVTPRKEPDEVEFLSGIFEGKTTGVPIGFIIRNTNQHSSDYDNLRETFRPSHGDLFVAIAVKQLLTHRLQIVIFGEDGIAKQKLIRKVLYPALIQPQMLRCLRIAVIEPEDLFRF